MREIIFRGKRHDDGAWVFGWYTMYPFGRWPLKHCIIPDSVANDGYFEHVEIDPATVGQYTGKTDKNGVKIFEGDICRYRTIVCGEVLEDEAGTVCFYHGSWTIINKFGCTAVGQCEPYELEVIGNVHNNPDLLEGTQ